MTKLDEAAVRDQRSDRLHRALCGLDHSASFALAAIRLRDTLSKAAPPCSSKTRRSWLLHKSLQHRPRPHCPRHFQEEPRRRSRRVASTRLGLRERATLQTETGSKHPDRTRRGLRRSGRPRRPKPRSVIPDIGRAGLRLQVLIEDQPLREQNQLGPAVRRGRPALEQRR